VTRPRSPTVSARTAVQVLNAGADVEDLVARLQIERIEPGGE
jgi:hypothetical protein